jgi:tight adherence protein B
VRRFLALVIGAVLLLANAASGQENAGLIRAVDSTDPAAVVAQFLATGEVDDAQVFLNGDEVDASAPEPVPDEKAVIFVVDTANVVDDANGITGIREGLKAAVQALDANELVAIVTATADVPELVSPFTRDVNSLLSAIDSITAVPESEDNPEGSSQLNRAILYAGDLFQARSSLQANMVIVAGSSDSTNPSRARGAISNAEAVVVAVNFRETGYSGGPTNTLVQDFGGRSLEAQTQDDLQAAIVEAHDTVKGQYQVTYASNIADGEVVDLRIEAGGQEFTASYVQGTSAVGRQTLNPDEIGGKPGISALQNSLGLILGLLFVLVACGLLAYGLANMVVPDDSLSNVLEVYAEGFGDDDDDDGNVNLAKSALIARAVELTEQVADSQGYLARAEGALERANLPLRAGEALFFYAAVVGGITVVALLLSGNLIVGLVLGLVAALIPPSVVNFLATRRKSKFLSQLPDTLQLLAGTLRAGYSLMQGIEAVSQEIDGPMGYELRRVVTEARLGRPVEESLEGTADRMASEDFAWCVMAIRIQREVGGNLAELLLTVADTMVARERLRRDVKTLTAEGRISAIILGILPVGLGFVMYALNPDYISKLFTDTLGNILLGLAIVAMGIGFYWMKRIIDIEI